MHLESVAVVATSDQEHLTSPYRVTCMRYVDRNQSKICASPLESQQELNMAPNGLEHMFFSAPHALVQFWEMVQRD